MLIECTEESLATALAQIADDAWRRDGDPSFPTESIGALAAAGALGLGAAGGAAMTQWAPVRAVAAADPVVGRIYERHLEALEHLYRHGPEPLRSDELDCVASGERLLGVWDTGDIVIRDDAVSGEVTNAIGAGGIHRAVILTDTPVYVDLRVGVDVDRSWRILRREPMSHGERVELHGVPVVAELAGFDAAALRSRAELRRVAAWMGTVDAMVEAATQALAARTDIEEEGALAAGRMAAARRTLDLWLTDAARQADANPDADLTALAAQTRAAIAVIAGSVMQEAQVAVRDGEPLAPFARAQRELAHLPGIERPDTALASAGRELLRRRRARG